MRKIARGWEKWNWRSNGIRSYMPRGFPALGSADLRANQGLRAARIRYAMLRDHGEL
jgi:hypothetical protein